MIASLDQLKSTLSGLTAADRAELARYLLHSLEAEDNLAQAEWLGLAKQRMVDIQAGRIVGIPADELLNSLPGSRP